MATEVADSLTPEELSSLFLVVGDHVKWKFVYEVVRVEGDYYWVRSNNSPAEYRHQQRYIGHDYYPVLADAEGNEIKWKPNH